MMQKNKVGQSHQKIRFWRASMKSIIKKSIENLELEALVSRRTYELFDRINFLEKRFIHSKMVM